MAATPLSLCSKDQNIQGVEYVKNIIESNLFYVLLKM